jgi:diguanylate cyclase (GGDEF)-like protein
VTRAHALRRSRTAVRVAAAPAGLLTLAAILLLVAARARPGTAMSVLIVLVAGVSAAVTGGEVLRQGWYARNNATFKRWMGAALVAWSAGQLLQAVLIAAAWPSAFPSVGNLLSLTSAPLAMAAALTIARAVGGAPTVVRTLLDAGLLSVCAGLVLWPTVAAHLLTPIDRGDVAIAVMVLFELIVIAVVIVTGVRNLDVNLLLIAAGMVFFAAGDLFDLVGGAGSDPAGGRRSGQLLWALAFPAIAWGTLHYRPMWRSEDRAAMDVDPDARVTVVTTTSSLLLLGLGVASILLQARPGSGRDRWQYAVSWCLVLTAIVLLWVRELLNTRLRVRLMSRLHDEATSDPLTGLANRRMLTGRLGELSPDEPWCLVALDLDGFKGVNDLLGHPVGDRLLCAVGNRLLNSMPPTALVSRTGGDEFALLVPGHLPAGVAAAHVVLAAVRRSCWDVEGVTRLPVTASVGVAAVSGLHSVTALETLDAALDPLSALSAAAAALQLAKAGGRDRIEVFDGAAALMRSRRLSIEERLRWAISMREIDVRYQPIVDLRTGALTGVEALARWVDSRLGTVHPQEFIPVAEQTGLVVALGELVLDQALEQAMLHDLPGRGIRVSCNVSPVQLRVPEFLQTVEQALATHRMPAESLVVEITESVLVEEDGPAVDTLQLLAAAGVTIAIDDFGTGYSALGYLRRLPAQILKIDRSLTVALIDEPQARAITRAVVDLGSSLGVSIVVEGIETSDVADLVSQMGVGYGQGTLFGSATTMNEIVRLSRRPSQHVRPA